MASTDNSSSENATPKFHEFNMCVMGIASVGKTSLMKRLTGTPFNRKSSCKPSLDDDATKYSIEGLTSAGPLLFHFYDWG